jgi:hypothetical protein
MNKRAYRTGWNYSSALDRFGSLDEAEDYFLSKPRKEGDHDAFLAGWIDYASDYDYGHAMKESN